MLGSIEGQASDFSRKIVQLAAFPHFPPEVVELFSRRGNKAFQRVLDRYVFGFEGVIIAEDQGKEISHIKALEVVLEQVDPDDIIAVPHDVLKSFHRII